MKKEVEEVFVHDQVYDYIMRLAQATRNNDALELGLSPRGSLALLKMAQARAYRKGRDSGGCCGRISGCCGPQGTACIKLRNG